MQRERDALQAQIRQADALERIADALEKLLSSASQQPVEAPEEADDGTE